MQKGIKKCFFFFHSTIFQTRFLINTRVFSGREKQYFNRNSHYVNRQTGKNRLINSCQNELFSDRSNFTTLFPMYVELLQSKFNDRTFSVALNVLYHNRQESSEHVKPSVEKLKKLFLNNLDSIKQANTIYTTLKKFRHMNVEILNNDLTKIGERQLALLSPPFYHLNDYGSSLAFSLRMFKKYNLSSKEIFDKINGMFIQNSSKIFYNYKLYAFVALSAEENILTIEHVIHYIHFFVSRKNFVTIPNLEKIFEGIGNHISFEENRLKYDSDNGTIIFKAIKEILCTFQSKQQEINENEYLQYLYVMLRLREMKALLKEAIPLSDLEEVESILEDVWKKNSKENKIFSAEVVNMPFLLVKCIKLLKLHKKNLEILNNTFKKQLIEGLILCLDVRHHEILTQENLEIITSYLQMEQGFIQKHSIICSLRMLVYEKIKKNFDNKDQFEFVTIKNLKEERQRYELADKCKANLSSESQSELLNNESD